MHLLRKFSYAFCALKYFLHGENKQIMVHTLSLLSSHIIAMHFFVPKNVWMKAYFGLSDYIASTNMIQFFISLY